MKRVVSPLSPLEAKTEIRYICEPGLLLSFCNTLLQQYLVMKLIFDRKSVTCTHMPNTDIAAGGLVNIKSCQRVHAIIFVVWKYTQNTEKAYIKE